APAERLVRPDREHDHAGKGIAGCHRAPRRRILDQVFADQRGSEPIGSRRSVADLAAVISAPTVDTSIQLGAESKESLRFPSNPGAVVIRSGDELALTEQSHVS